MARYTVSAPLELALELGFGQLDADGAAMRAIFDIRAGQDLAHEVRGLRALGVPSGLDGRLAGDRVQQIVPQRLRREGFSGE